VGSEMCISDSHYYCVITIAIAVLGNFQLWEYLLAIAVVAWLRTW